MSFQAKKKRARKLSEGRNQYPKTFTSTIVTIAQRIHGTGIFTYINGWFCMGNVGKYTSRMDGMGRHLSYYGNCRVSSLYLFQLHFCRWEIPPYTPTAGGPSHDTQDSVVNKIVTSIFHGWWIPFNCHFLQCYWVNQYTSPGSRRHHLKNGETPFGWW